MKRLIFIFIALGGLMTACNPEDPIRPKMWRRQVQPWLSGRPQWEQCRQKPVKEGRLIAEMQCGPEPALQKAPCDKFITDHEEARRQLVEAPHCIEEVLEALDRFTATSPDALSDIAAAHYVRAQREDEPSHLLQALFAADQAVAANPRSTPALFNLALIQEALGFRRQAMESWDAFLALDATSQWAAEAQAHQNALKPLLAYNAAERWEATEPELERAITARDEKRVRALVEEFPSAAYRFLARQMLPSRPDDARVLAKVLSERFGGDPDPLDRIADPSGSLPMRLSKTINDASEMSKAKEYTGALVLLDSIAPSAREHHYDVISAQIEMFRGVSLWPLGRHIEALTAYREALKIYERTGDREGMANARTRMAGIYRLIGAEERAWGEVFAARFDSDRLRHAQERHAYLGEAGAAAAAFGHLPIALIYQVIASDEAQARLRTATADQRPDAVKQSVIALYHLAELQLQLGRIEDATRNLDEAGRLTAEYPDEETRRLLEGRLQEVRAELLLRSDPQGAVRALTVAIENMKDELPARQAELYSRRAEAHLNANDVDAAVRDLEHSIGLAQAEQQNVLARRTRDEAAEVWSAYFSRYRETYDLLTGKMMEGRRPEVAFSYNERGRAAEPLDLLRQLGLLPAELRRRYETNDINLAYIQNAIPSGTFILQYAVLSDRTYVWILSRELSVAVTLPVTREDVTGWTSALQSAAERNDEEDFEEGLTAPYGGLFLDALQIVHRMNGRRGMPRIVVVPDGPMHGLPFAALRNTKGKRYLAEEATVEIAGSTALYLVSLERDRALAPGVPSLLLIGNPPIGNALKEAYDLPNLRYAAEEAERIAKDYGAQIAHVVSDATPARFLSLAPDYSTIHVAAHAIVNAREPHNSFLALAADGNDTGELDAQELLTQVKLDRTRLVVLSTCRSAGGAPVGLEGVAPLVRPFIGAGVPAVIGTLWDLNDNATTRDLLVSFHQHYRSGKDAAAALQAAQLAQLRDRANPGRQPALAWGSFQVIGHASSPFASRAPMKKEKPP